MRSSYEYVEPTRRVDAGRDDQVPVVMLDDVDAVQVKLGELDFAVQLHSERYPEQLDAGHPVAAILRSAPWEAACPNVLRPRPVSLRRACRRSRLRRCPPYQAATETPHCRPRTASARPRSRRGSASPAASGAEALERRWLLTARQRHHRPQALQVVQGDVAIADELGHEPADLCAAGAILAICTNVPVMSPPLTFLPRGGVLFSVMVCCGPAPQPSVLLLVDPRLRHRAGRECAQVLGAVIVDESEVFECV